MPAKMPGVLNATPENSVFHGTRTAITLSAKLTEAGAHSHRDMPTGQTGMWQFRASRQPNLYKQKPDHQAPCAEHKNKNGDVKSSL
jgi:hypothetical protein